MSTHGIDAETWEVASNLPSFKLFLVGDLDGNNLPRPNPSLVRKSRLLAVAALRAVWAHIPDVRCRDAVQLAETYADNRDAQTLEEAHSIAIEVYRRSNRPNRGGFIAPTWKGYVAGVVRAATEPDDLCAEPPRYIGYGWDDILDELESAPERSREQARIYHLALFHDLFPNPFRPVPFDPSWRTQTAVALAEAIYADRAWDRMAVVADALEQAGCTDARVLDHCRGPGPHTRGCSVVDAILGKS